MDPGSNVVVTGPTSDAWDLHRPKIKRLYLDDGNTLKDVIDIMKREHKFTASVKMYKSRISLWKLDSKNLKKRHVKQIARAKVERDAIGKKSKFMLNSEIVDVTNVERNVRKRGYRSLEAYVREASPYNGVKDVECLTPDLSPMPILPDRMVSSFDEDDNYGDVRCQVTTENNPQERMHSTPTPYATKQANRLHSVLAMSPVSRSWALVSLSPRCLPPGLNATSTAPERLFRLIDSYVRAQYERCQPDICTDDWIETGGYKGRQAEYPSFAQHCETASLFFSRKKYVECRQALSAAGRNMEENVSFENPLFLDEFIRSYLGLHANGANLAANLVLKHVSDYASITLGIDHPIAQFLFNCLQVRETSVAVMTRLLQCLNDVAGSTLGLWHIHTLETRFNVLNNMCTDEAIYLSRKLLTLCNSTWIRGRSEWFETMRGVLIVLYNNSQYGEAETIARVILAAASPEPASEIYQNACIMAFEVLSYILFQRDDTVAAFEYMEMSIEAGKEAWGTDHPNVVGNMLSLAGLLDKHGLEEKSEMVKAQIAQALGSPIIEELLETPTIEELC